MPINKVLVKCLLITLLGAGLVGCQSQRAKTPLPHPVYGDGPPLIDKDVSQIPDAVPKAEPPSAYGNPAKYKALGKEYKTMQKSEGYKAVGQASWYGRKFHGKRTSSGEPYDMFGMTAAHPSLVIPTYAKVKNLNNGKEVIVKINDRGPFANDRLIDLSYAAAKKLGFHNKGIAKVEVTAIDPKKWKPGQNSDQQLYLQLGAYNNKSNAEKIALQTAKKIKALKPANAEVKTEQAQTASLYKVKIGPLKDRIQAQAMQKKLLAQYDTATTLVYE